MAASGVSKVAQVVPAVIGSDVDRRGRVVGGRASSIHNPRSERARGIWSSFRKRSTTCVGPDAECAPKVGALICQIRVGGKVVFGLDEVGGLSVSLECEVIELFHRYAGVGRLRYGLDAKKQRYATLVQIPNGRGSSGVFIGGVHGSYCLERVCWARRCRRSLRNRTVSGPFFLVTGIRGAWWVVGQGEAPVGRTCERVPNRSKGAVRVW